MSEEHRRVPPTLESIPPEILRKIILRIHNPMHSAASPTPLHSLLRASKTLFHATAPLAWHSPRIGPLSSCASWRAFLDAIAGGGRSFKHSVMENYAEMLVAVEDVWLFVGGEDEDQSEDEDEGEEQLAEVPDGSQGVTPNAEDELETTDNFEEPADTLNEGAEADSGEQLFESIQSAADTQIEIDSNEKSPAVCDSLNSEDKIKVGTAHLERKDSKICDPKKSVSTTKPAEMSLAEKYSELRDPSICLAPVSSNVKQGDNADHTLLSSILGPKQDDDEFVVDSQILVTSADAECSKGQEPFVTSKRWSKNRDHFLSKSSTRYLDLQSRNSLHYGLAIILTHCPNLRSVRLHLPAAPLAALPISVPLSRSLKVLEIYQKVTDSTLASMFPLNQTTTLSTLALYRPEISNVSLKYIATLTCLSTLHLPSPPKAMHSVIPGMQPPRRRIVNANLPRLPPPSPTHNALISLFETLSRTLSDLDISGCSAEPAPPQYQSSPDSSHLTSSHPLLNALSKLQLRNLVIALSPSSGLTLSSLSTLTLPGLKNTLERLTVVPRPEAVRIDESTVDEDEVLKLFSATVGTMSCSEARLSGWKMKSVLLQGLDFVGGGGGGSGVGCGGGGGLRFYYGVVGDPWRVDWVVGKFRDTWEGVQINVKCER